MSCSNVSVFPTCIVAVRCRSVHAFFPFFAVLNPCQGETIGQKLNRLSLAVMLRRRSAISPPDRDHCLLATHPSDHNAVYVKTVSDNGREKRLSKMRKRKERDLEKLKQGKLDEKTHKRGSAHDDAFLVPVPLYYGYGIPGAGCSGIAGGFGAGCVTVSCPSSHRSCLCFLIVSPSRNRV